ncbi:MAG: M1 family metallopeptidase [Paraglaciecola sp.]|nr:M1 family metallopeptidase [Paraglaciecola sp.]
MTVIPTFISHSIKSVLALSFFNLVACSSIEPPLDPIIGDTGQVLSATAQSADVLSYDLQLEVFPDKKRIQGIGTTEFLIISDTQQLELKLDSRFAIEKVTVNQTITNYRRVGGILTIALGQNIKAGSKVNVAVYYEGKPHVALNAPWLGGFVWSETEAGLPWIATAVQGEGCDLFWPCKDHFSDKADTMRIRLTVPKGLSAVTNGVLQNINNIGTNKQQFDWLLSVPASDYNIALNIGPYTRIQQRYESVNGVQVPIEFWALTEHAEQATTLLNNDLSQQISYFEKQLGPYPWGDQKLGFVETPHLGMEHQTINAYGKKYVRDENGYDWLLQHELAHEWFGNLMTHEKLNDAWLHEGFGFYMQPAYSLAKFGRSAYNYTMYKSYLGLINCEPVVKEGQISSEQAFNSDIYGKGGWTLHTLRWLLGDDVFWQATRELLYGTADTAKLNYPIETRYRNTQEFIDIVNRISGKDYTWMFDVYLKQAALPELKITRNDEQLGLYWSAPSNRPFPMPVPISINGELAVYPMMDGKTTLNIKASDEVVIDPDMQVLRQLPIIGLCQENLAKRKKR